MNSEPETLPNLQTVLDAINDLRQEMSAKLNGHDNRFEDIRLQLMTFDARIDRLQAMSHENLNIAYNLRADVKILREEVSAWSKDAEDLRLKAA